MSARLPRSLDGPGPGFSGVWVVTALSVLPARPNLQLMSMILIMVRTKKGRGSICTFTRIAVTRNTSRMATRLPRIRTDWGILQRERQGVVRAGRPGTVG